MMRLIGDRTMMLEALQALSPTKIAVAYVGSGWRELLGNRLRLKQIVLSPTMGTNPRAVERIAAEIGWANVHFLDELHAKLYLSSSAAIFGSANLSSNALGQGGTELYELVVHSTDPDLVAAAALEFERYRSLAMDCYGTEADKKKHIWELKMGQPAIDAARIKLERPQAPTLGDFEVGSRRVHLEWHEAGGREDEDAGDDGQTGDREYMNLLLAKPGQARVGDWLLEWTCLEDGRVGRGFSLTWLRIDAVRPGVHNLAYPDQVAQRNLAPRSTHPFQIDPLVKKVFRKLIMEHDELRPQDWETPLPSPPISSVNSFLRDLQRRYVAAL